MTSVSSTAPVQTFWRRSRCLLASRCQAALVCLAWLFALTALVGCSADAARLAEPTLITPGAFIAVPSMGSRPAAGAAGAAGDSAVEEDMPVASSAGASGSSGKPAQFRLIRVLFVLETSNDLAVFYLDYGVKESLRAAREGTRQRASGPAAPYQVTSLGRLMSLGAVVVGYRSLTAEEREVLR